MLCSESLNAKVSSQGLGGRAPISSSPSFFRHPNCATTSQGADQKETQPFPPSCHSDTRFIWITPNTLDSLKYAFSGLIFPMGSKLFPLDHVAPLLCPDAGQINLSTWHHFVPCVHRHKSELHAMCYICSLVWWVPMKRMAEPVLCQNRAPQLPSSLLLLLRTCRFTCKVVFLLWLVSVFHLFPGMAFLKHPELVDFAKYV